MDIAMPTSTSNDKPDFAHDTEQQSDEQVTKYTSTGPNHVNLNDPRNPQNWPEWKKNLIILMICFHSMWSVFMAAGLIPGFKTFVKLYDITLEQASYLVSAQILLLGVSPILWNMVTEKLGRHHVLIFSVLGSMVCNIGGARCTTYASQMVTRVLTAFLISPPIGIGSGVVAELCRPDQRARKLGWWVMMTILGTPSGPFIMGFVVQHAGVQWIFWVYVIVNFLQAVCYILFGQETIYYEPADDAPKQTGFGVAVRSLLPRRLDSRPLSLHDLFAPLLLGAYPRVLVPALATAITFCYGNILFVVEMPISFGEKFHLDAQQIGLQYISVVIGCAIGEMLAGPASDYFMKTLARRKTHVYAADRLWLTYIGFLTIIAGLLIWGFQLEKATEKWNVTPCVGVAIGSFGNQIQSTILTTYAVDSHREHAAMIGVFFNIARLVYGFIGPFYFPYMFDSLGFAGAAGVMCGILVVGGMIPTVVLQIATSRPRN